MAQHQQRVTQIPAIASALTVLFILRSLVSFCLIAAGIGVLCVGSRMFYNASGAGGEALIKLADGLEITASGFGAIVMVSAIVPFVLAYLSRPTLNVAPVPLNEKRQSTPARGDPHPVRMVVNRKSQRSARSSAARWSICELIEGRTPAPQRHLRTVPSGSGLNTELPA